MKFLRATNANRRCSAAATLFVVAVLLSAPCVGCGDSDSFSLAPVSGVATLDGKPIPRAIVAFQPVGTAENPNPGPGSVAEADASGLFELKTVRGDVGAVVGPHTVTISSYRPPMASSNDSGLATPKFKEVIPARYNANSELKFDVPADGTAAADFKLTTAP